MKNSNGLEIFNKTDPGETTQCIYIVNGNFPRRDMEERVVQLNKVLVNVAAHSKISYADARNLFIKTDGKIDELLFSDGLHPNAAGYEKLGAFITARLNKVE